MSERAMRIGLVFFGVLNLVTGLTMMVTPHWLFDHIGPYGIRNDHYLGDTGSFYVAAGLGLLVAIQRQSWRAPLLAVAAAWYGLHALNHLFDVGDNNKGDGHGWTDTILIAVGALALAYKA